MSAETSEKSVKGQKRRKTGCKKIFFLAPSKSTWLKVDTYKKVECKKVKRGKK